MPVWTHELEDGGAVLSCSVTGNFFGFEFPNQDVAEDFLTWLNEGDHTFPRDARKLDREDALLGAYDKYQERGKP